MNDSRHHASGEELPRPAVLIVLDVDGTISRIYRQDEYAEHRDDPDWYEWLPLDEAVVDALDVVAQRPGIQIAWLTSWAPNQDYLDHFIDGPRLRGRLHGDCVPWIDSSRRGWRARSLLAYAERVRPHALVWADDRAPRSVSATIDERLGIPRLVLRPHVNVGLTNAHVERVRAFVDEHTVRVTGHA